MLIVGLLAVDKNFGIGKDGKLPWHHNKHDMKFFKLLTDGGKVVMGRSTWDSLPVKPLPNRDNYVLTNNGSCLVGATRISENDPLPIDTNKHTFIIGGNKTILHFGNKIDAIVLSHIDGEFECDTFLDNGALKEMHLIENHLCEYLNISVYAKVNNDNLRTRVSTLFDRVVHQGKPQFEMMH